MNETADLPEQRPMPEGLRDRLWAEDIEPHLGSQPSRSHPWRVPLTAAAAVVALAAGVVFAVPLFRDSGATAASGPDMALVNACIHTPYTKLPPGAYRAAARLDLDATTGYLVIRDDEYAAICDLTNGIPTRSLGSVIGTHHTYANLTASRPWDYLSSDNRSTESVHFGIAAPNVAKVVLIGPDGSQTPTVLKDGTFIARTKFAEDSGNYTSNRIKATLDTGQEIEGPFRS
ncbi:hypothetical protein [Kutzneria sp. NPDC052558]|uniref:hypothetical protein n=1 Tax=Kutzneria sp. NPDC052558 TaxID=3364121 RepID=UPI0037CC66F4